MARSGKCRDLLAGDHNAAIVWFTGLSGAGKTTLATALASRLSELGCKAFVLDGDAVRSGLSNDLGFSAADRSENLRRAAEVAALLADQGFIVLAAFITPLQADRRYVRKLLEGSVYLEAHVDVPLSVAEGRDPKGLYLRARRGEITNFTGVDSPYEVPQTPELHLDGEGGDIQGLCGIVLGALERVGVVPAVEFERHVL